MAVQRMHHVGIVVEDLEGAAGFFAELGFVRQGGWQVEGGWVDGVVGLEGARSDIVMMETPDGHGRVELTRFLSPPVPDGDPQAPAHVPGIRHIAFEVDDLDDTLARLHAHGGRLVGEIEAYKDVYRLCYLRGPEGIIIELAERLG
mgnify:CR=1 FL=1